MTRLLLAVAAATAIATPMTFAQDAADLPAEADLPVQAVTLFSSGVGFFQHGGTVDGEAGTQLRFKADQVDDLLKSLVLQDLDGGAVNAITYPSVEPLDRQLGSFQIDLSNPSLVGILGQLKGAQLTLRTIDGDAVEGTVVSVDHRTVADGEATLSRPFVTLFADGALRSMAVERIDTFELVDERLRQEMARALAAVAEARDKDKKAVGFSFSGEGERRIRLGYVVEAPVWKTSYRLILGEGDEPTLQGWAIIENQTDNDWQNVQLSLVSGRPISFEMNLSEPLFVQRPTVSIPRYASLTPKRYDGGTGAVDELADLEASRARRSFAGGGGGGFGGGGGGGAPMAMSSAPMAADAMAESMEMTGSVQSVASGVELGEYFEYTVGDVTIPRQSSAMLPIISDAIEAEKVSLYDPQQLRQHPLNAAILTNTTGKPLLAGPVTVFEQGGYAGDSQVGDLPDDADRLITFGIDTKVTARVEPGRRTSEIVTGSMSRGVLTIKRRLREPTEYVFDNESDEPRTLVIEHAPGRDAELVDTPDPFEETESARRFKLELPPGAGKFVVTTERLVDERQQLLQGRINADGLIALSRRAGLPQAVRDALARAAELRRDIAQTQEQVNAAEAELQEIAQDQARIRQNMNAVNRQSGYYQRLMTKLDEQETRIETIRESLDELRDTLEERENAYRDFLEKLDV